jgi:acetyl-CoA C-acetyltransferase
LGFFKKGTGAEALEEGETEIGGKIPINTSGGLLSKGHPIGATGMGQIYEIVEQLRGEAPNQVSDAKVGMAHNFGATGTVCVVSILKR